MTAPPRGYGYAWLRLACPARLPACLPTCLLVGCGCFVGWFSDWLGCFAAFGWLGCWAGSLRGCLVAAWVSCLLGWLVDRWVGGRVHSAAAVAAGSYPPQRPARSGNTRAGFWESYSSMRRTRKPSSASRMRPTVVSCGAATCCLQGQLERQLGVSLSV